jgi:TolB-like protein/Tfp pilus assembly protein PilF
MASLIPGFEYDIFISYRQKDNKGDRWVSKFVDALKTELEATFKEDISVYFDENPHDRLQETHNVDKSLEGKLSCLIFIPILSQTYCDPNSYAWQYEFLAFLRMAEQDRFGKDIKLRSGNVACRILPIRIHDLEQEDIKLFEKETGSVLRAMDFVFKTASGVNRPLKANEDHAQDNLNKTFYSDQINKVANATKEIIMGIKAEPDLLVKGEPHLKESNNKDEKYYIRKKVINKGSINQKSKKWLIIVLSVTLFIIGVFAVFKIIEKRYKNNDIVNLEKSIAVLPFVNDSPDQENAYFINGIMDEMLNNLQKIKDFRVLSRTSTDQYRGTIKPPIPKIAKDLGVNYIVEGSGQKYGNTFRLRVQLIAAKKEKHLWGDSFEKEIKETKDIFKIQSQVAQAIASELLATITLEEKQLIENVPTKNIEAYDLYLQGRYFWDLGGRDNLNRSIELYQKALKIDQDYALAYSGLAASYTKYAFTGLSPRRDVMPQAKLAAMNALKIDSTLGEAHAELALARAVNDWDWTESEKGFKRAIELNPDYASGHSRYAWLLAVVGRLDEGIQEAKRAHELAPLSVDIWKYYGWNYFVARDYDSAIEEYRKILDLFPNERSVHTSIAMALLQKGLYNEAIEECSKNESGPSRNWRHGYIYGIAGKREKALEILNHYLDLSKKEFVWPTNIVFIYIGLGEKDKAFEWLEKTYKEHEAYLDLLQVEPMYDPLRSDPRFKDLLKKMNFPDQNKSDNL